MNPAIFSQINWLAVLVSTIAYFALGAIWYSFLFQKKWIVYTGVNVSDPNAKKGMAAIMFTSFILMFICVFGLAFLITKFNLHTWMLGVKIGLLTGVCFCAMAISISYVYEKRAMGLHMINGAYYIVGNIIAGIILCLWK
jgi:hypothetical protein